MNTETEFKNKEITVTWKPELCIHVGSCANELPTVFDPANGEFMDLEAEPTPAIVAQIKRCPSGALSFKYNHEGTRMSDQNKTTVEVKSNGPILVFGEVCIKNSKGEETIKSGATALCRCGASANKPYCDGAHVKARFTAE